MPKTDVMRRGAQPGTSSSGPQGADVLQDPLNSSDVGVQMDRDDEKSASRDGGEESKSRSRGDEKTQVVPSSKGPEGSSGSSTAGGDDRKRGGDD